MPKKALKRGQGFTRKAKGKRKYTKITFSHFEKKGQALPFKLMLTHLLVRQKKHQQLAHKMARVVVTGKIPLGPAVAQLLANHSVTTWDYDYPMPRETLLERVKVALMLSPYCFAYGTTQLLSSS